MQAALPSNRSPFHRENRSMIISGLRPSTIRGKNFEVLFYLHRHLGSKALPSNRTSKTKPRRRAYQIQRSRRTNIFPFAQALAFSIPNARPQQSAQNRDQPHHETRESYAHSAIQTALGTQKTTQTSGSCIIVERPHTFGCVRSLCQHGLVPTLQRSLG